MTGKHSETYYYQRAVELAREAMNNGNDGFASLLVSPEGDILLEHTNVAKEFADVTAHDTIMLVREALKKYPASYLKECTVYAMMEPCIMCMGAIYWANIGTVNFAVSEEEYSIMRGGGGLEIHSKEFAQRCGKDIKIIGPSAECHDMVLESIKEHIRRKTEAAK